MQDLNLPDYEFRFQREDDHVRIYDELRKKYVALTPEEWVRQNFIRFLVSEKAVPAGLIQQEKQLVINTMSRRPDIVVHDKHGKAVMIIECKAPEVKISQDTFDQVARYNSALKVPYLIVTNGLQHYCCKIDIVSNTYSFLKDIPVYEDLRLKT